MEKYNISLMLGDITKVADQFDAIVNAANNSLLGGGGVDGAIHRAAGRGLLMECMKLRGCETGEAKITGAHKLPCKNIIHTVGPEYYPGFREAPVLLYSAYCNSLEMARLHGLKKIAFPSISTGIYSYPVDEAAAIAIKAAMDFLKHNPDYEITWVLYDDETFAAYDAVLKEKTN